MRHHLLLQDPSALVSEIWDRVLSPRFHATDEEMRSQLTSQLLRDPDNKIKHSLEVADSLSWGDKLVPTHPVRQILPLQAGLESENAGTFALKRS